MQLIANLDECESEQFMKAFAAASQQNLKELHKLNRKVDALRGENNQEAADLSELLKKVTEASGRDASLLALVEGIADELDSRPGLQALSNKLRAIKNDLKNAVEGAPA